MFDKDLKGRDLHSLLATLKSAMGICLGGR